MSSTPIRNLLAGQTLSDEERARLLRATRRLRDRAREGREDQPLKGRHLAIAGTRAGNCADPVEAAALRLGARVSHIGPRALAPLAVPERLARVLGRLYDAVDCTALSPDEARWLQRQAGVPVFDGLATDGHPLLALLPAVQAMDGHPDRDEALSSLLQAVLVEALA